MSVCRTCLSTNGRMHDLKKTQLQQIFEKLTNVQVTVDAMSTICYICFSQLRRCQRFVHMSQTADKILQQAFSKQTELLCEAARALPVSGRLAMTPVQVMSLGMPPDACVKQEPPQVKQEVLEEGEEGVEGRDFEVELQVVKLEDLGWLPDPGPDTSTPAVRLDCSECGKVFPHQKNLNRHINQVHMAQRLTCEHCHKGYARKYYKTHMLRCKADPRAFERTFQVQRPAESERAEPSQWFTCELCERAFHSKRQLVSHLRVHSGEKPYSCGVCGRAFSQLSSLRKHAGSHDQEKRFVCDTCDKGFSSRTALVVHLGVHEDLRPHRCGMCGRGFSQRGHLRRHIEVHAPVSRRALTPSFTCRVCGKTLLGRSSLRRHERGHAGARPHRCNVCGSAFAAVDSLRRHLRIHTGERPYACACGKAFVERSHLTYHKKQCRVEINCALYVFVFIELQSMMNHSYMSPQNCKLVFFFLL